jgi:hypothetical protein
VEIGLSKSLSEAVQVISGEKLSSITFVLDYWQFDFDGHSFTIMTAIEVVSGGVKISDSEVGFRDLFCEQIGKIAVSAIFQNELLVIAFADGSEIRCFARPDDYTGPEALIFKSYKSEHLYVV